MRRPAGPLEGARAEVLEDAYTRRIGWELFFGGVMIAFGCGLLVLVDAPRRMLHRIRPPRYAVTPPVRTERHVIAASFRRRTGDAPAMARGPVGPAVPEPEDLWVAEPGPWG